MLTTRRVPVQQVEFALARYKLSIERNLQKSSGLHDYYSTFASRWLCFYVSHKFLYAYNHSQLQNVCILGYNGAPVLKALPSGDENYKPV